MKPLYLLGSGILAVLLLVISYFSFRPKAKKAADKTRVTTLAGQFWQGCRNYASKLNVFGKKQEGFEAA
jgi:hypothetical protein